MSSKPQCEADDTHVSKPTGIYEKYSILWFTFNYITATKLLTYCIQIRNSHSAIQIKLHIGSICQSHIRRMEVRVVSVTTSFHGRKYSITKRLGNLKNTFKTDVGRRGVFYRFLIQFKCQACKLVSITSSFVVLR